MNSVSSKEMSLLINDALSLHVSDEMIDTKEPTLPAYERLSFTQERYAVFVIGASWASKILPKEKVADICNALTCKTYIVWGSEKERSDAEFVAQNSE